jgi:hypothetical protein
MGYDKLLFHGRYVLSFSTDLVLNIFLSPLKLQRFSLNMRSVTVRRMKGIWPVNPKGQTLNFF